MASLTDWFGGHMAAVLWGGALLGLLYGLVAQWSRFCLVRGLFNHWHGNDSRLLRAFALAMAVALLASQSMVQLGWLSLERTIYTPANPVLPLIFIGGLLFGVGMTFANACGARSLVLLGSGNLRSLVVLLVLGITAYMTLSGLLATVRLYLENLLRLPVPASTLPGLLASLGLPSAPAYWLSLLGLSSLLLWFSLGHRPFRQSRKDWLGGLVIGLLVAGGWWVTGVLGADDFEPVRLASLTFVAPIGESLQYLMLSTGSRLSFAVVVVAGILLGSLARALFAGEFQWQSYESPRQMGKGLIGGVLMGFGGIIALGCTLGQGLTGFSTLALSSLVALLGITLGARLGFRWR